MSQEVWNRQNAINRLNGKESLYNKLLQKYFDSAPELISNLNIDLHDPEIAIRNAHTLKSLSGTVGATKLSMLSAKLENEHSSLPPSECNLLLEEINLAFEEFKALADSTH